ncbi:EamA family transporter [Sodalis sp. RH21]|uniref:DMT family transporter n=1 Tax=unclassified Sodalis (in: enterobacteria) TaxID=2636512 RepID=UPI0039B589B5
MSASLIAIVLFAACLHACWNAVVKGAGDKLLATILVSGMAGMLAACALPFLTPPAPPSWGFIAASALCQVGYYLLIANTYRIADMSQAYPLMRGSAPVFVALASPWVIGESLSPPAWAGILLISGGIMAMIRGRGLNNRKGVWLALATAVVIAAYTLIDGIGVRRSAAPAAYTLWIFLLTAMVLLGWVLLARRTAFVHYARGNLHYGVIGGAGTLASYGIALWAMTKAPVALVAGLRETSILFAVLIAVAVLKERVRRDQWAMIALITAGAVLLRLA